MLAPFFAFIRVRLYRRPLYLNLNYGTASAPPACVPSGKAAARQKNDFFKIALAFCRKLCYDSLALVVAQLNIRVWRSLVSRLNGVQEAPSSNLGTRTKQ